MSVGRQFTTYVNEEWTLPSAKYPHYFRLCKVLHEVFVESGKAFAIFGWAKFSDKSGSGSYDPRVRHVVGFKPMDSDVYPPVSLNPVPAQEVDMTASQCYGPSQLQIGRPQTTPDSTPAETGYLWAHTGHG